jgi:tetratricopeptide (TPR) repeat protein
MITSRCWRAAAGAQIALLACGGMKATRPTTLRELPQSDVSRCYQAAHSLGNKNLQGFMELYQIVDEQGDVPAAFVHHQSGIDSPAFFNCMTLLGSGSKFPAQGIDYLRPNPMGCDSANATCTRLSLKDEQQAPLDEKLAQDTLTFADWATPTDRGWGYYLVRKYKDALDQFQKALEQNANDVRALRGRAVAMAESGGDLAQAKESAQKALQLQPASESTHEAMLRVCLAQKDDRCTYEEFEAARKAPDFQVRSFELAALQGPAKAAADRLTARAAQEEEKRRQQAEADLQKADPAGCRKMEANSDAQLLCLIKRCFESGADQYAKELKPLTGQDYAAGDWKLQDRNGENAQVTVPIRVAPPKKGKSKKKSQAADADTHDATWKVTVGENITMMPLNLDAANIATRYDACKK